MTPKAFFKCLTRSTNNFARGEPGVTRVFNFYIQVKFYPITREDSRMHETEFTSHWKSQGKFKWEWQTNYLGNQDHLKARLQENIFNLSFDKPSTVIQAWSNIAMKICWTLSLKDKIIRRPRQDTYLNPIVSRDIDNPPLWIWGGGDLKSMTKYVLDVQ